MKWAVLKFPAQSIQGQGLVEMLLDEPANRLHPVGLRVATERSWPAPQTSAISSLFGLFGPGEELNVLAPRAARRARRPAIHARTRNREDEFSIARGIARHHGIPARVSGCLGWTHQFGWMDRH